MVSVGVKVADSVYDPADSTVVWVTAWGEPPLRVAVYAKPPAMLFPFKLAVASSIPVQPSHVLNIFDQKIILIMFI